MNIATPAAALDDTPAAAALRAMLQGASGQQGGAGNDVTQALADQIDRVEQNIGYHFANPALLRVALRHSSLGGVVNTQLAWLGQNLVGFLAASEAYSINPAGDRKTMHAHREVVTNKEGMAAAAERLDLPPYLQLHAGQTQGLSAGMKGDLFTAVLGAIFVDSGGSDLTAARVVFGRSQQRPAAAAQTPAAAPAANHVPLALVIAAAQPAAVTAATTAARPAQMGAPHPAPAAQPVAIAAHPALMARNPAAMKVEGPSALQAPTSRWQAGGASQPSAAVPVKEEHGEDVDILGM